MTVLEVSHELYLTVAICTWNRARLLDQTLTQMRQLRVPAEIKWELLVVNNASTDDTEEVISRHSHYLPLRRLYESRQGHSFARNCAIDAARGDLVLWTDDDVLVESDWLSCYAAAARAWPDASYFGGTIDEWMEVPATGWIKRHWASISGVFVIRNFGSYVGPFRKGESPAGANMAFRRRVFEHFRFNDRLGRVRGTLTGADDTEFIQRLYEAGHQGICVGPARVRHFIPADRLTRAFLKRWFVGAGRTHVRQNGVEHCSYLFGVPRWALVSYCHQRLWCMCCEPFRGPRWFHAFREAAILEGFLREVSHEGRTIRA